MAWWQKKFLGFCLKYVGIFDDSGIDLDNLDIALGQQSSVELRDVALNTDRLSKLIQLPPGLRVEAAKVLRLKLSVPLNVFSGTVKFEADGVRVKARYRDEQAQQDSSVRPSQFGNPQHRKTHRRTEDRLRAGEDADKPHIPTAEEMARSFLLERPPEERKQLEASLGTGPQDMDESMLSESSESSDVGTGTSVGLPGVFAGYVQGFMDRCQVHVDDVEISLDTAISGASLAEMAVSVRMRLASAALIPFDVTMEDPKREIKLGRLTVDMLSSEAVFSDLSGVPARSSPSASRENSDRGLFSRETSYLTSNDRSSTLPREHDDPVEEGVGHPNTITGAAGSRSQDTASKTSSTSTVEVTAATSQVLDIRPGDDNISWGSRRQNAPVQADESLWGSTEDLQDLPDSLLIEQATAPRDKSRSTSPEAFRRAGNASQQPISLQSHSSWSSDHAQLGEQETGPFRSLQGARIGLQSNHEQVMEPGLPLVKTHMEGEPAELVEDMTESRLYTHEEAESMYMSAISHRSPDARRSDSDEEPVFSFIAERTTDPQVESETPRPSSPVHLKAAAIPASADLISVQLLVVDYINLGLSRSSPAQESQKPLDEDVVSPFVNAPSNNRAMPGTFSMTSDMYASRMSTRSRPTAGPSTTTPVQQESPTPPAVDVAIGAVEIGLDIASCRMLFSVASRITGQVETAKKTPFGADAKTSLAGTTTWPSIVAAFDSASIHLHDRLPTRTRTRSGNKLCILQFGFTRLFSTPDRIQVDVDNLALYIGTCRLLAVGDVERPAGSSNGTPSISLELAKERTLKNGKVFTELHVHCVPINVDIDLHAIDQAFGSFGGISGFLELSSIMGESALTATTSPKTGKGVRFEQVPSAPPGDDLKANVRIETIDVALRGKSASIALSTSVVKAIYRDGAATATIDQTKVTGPHTQNEQAPPVEITLGGIRVDFLQSPRDQDLERLLSLLTPSKDKYDSDDDILLDTLLRQRRKGSLAKISVGDVACKIDTFTDFNVLLDLIEETSTLSAVAKYLPEDERPGMLTLLRLASVNISVPLNERFGAIDIMAEDVCLAHVGMPSLIALSIQSAKATSLQYGNLLHAFLPLSGSDNLPVIMARMLGDEAEPVARIKLYNLCLEYSVPALLALTGLDQDADAGDLIGELAQSVATLNPVSRPVQTTEMSPKPDSTSKPLRIDLLVHELAIGLRPLDSPAKAALVLTDAKFTTCVPAETSMSANLELRKAALFLTNNYASQQPFESRNAPRNSSSTHRTATALSQQGFASIASIMSASISVQLNPIAAESEISRSVRVDIRNELLLLETCADSTQTMFGLLAGLAPPPRPPKRSKYLTEPMPIGDMMASFSGDAYSQPLSDATAETLFDVDEDREADSFFDDAEDDLLVQSDMTSSLYGPVSGLLSGVDRQEDEQESANGDWEGAVESLLEDDPFEMPVVPTDVHLSDTALMRDLTKQSLKPIRADPVALELTEFEDLGLDALGPEHNALGTTQRFNTAGVSRKQWTRSKKTASPSFQLHLRDAHVIWNIYDGYDWQGTRDGITEAVEKVEAKVEERKARRRHSRNDADEDESVIGDFLFNSIYIGVPTSQDAQDIRRQINRHIDDLASETESIPFSGISRPASQYTAGGAFRDTKRRRRLKLDRSRAHKIAFELKGLSADLLVMPPSSETTLQNIQLRVRDFEIFDNVPTSTWRKFLTHFESEPHRRETAKPMIHIEVDNVKTNAVSDAAELKINVTVAPLRLHVDQDALDFITRFFEFKDKPAEAPNKANEQPFIQRLEVNTVDLRLDYKPKYVDYAGLRSGHTSEFMNFVTLDGADIRLRHAIVYGIKGFEPLHPMLNNIWMPDVMRNQLPTVLSGLAPVRSLVNIGTGVRDVVAIPIREYRKDGRLVRSIQKGAFQFGKTTAAELARLGAKVALGTQNILQGAEGVLSGSTVSSSAQRGPLGAAWQDVGTGEEEEHEHRALSSYANQPLGVLSGLRSARQHLERDLLTARDALIAVQGEVLESSSPGAAAAAVVRHAPTLILRPVIGASRAVGTTLLGVGNQIDRGNVRRVDDKYKRH